MNLWKMELKNCLSRIEFKVVFLVFFLISIGTFIEACYIVYGSELTFIRSAYEMSILQGTSTKIMMNILLVLLPLIIPVIYSNSLITDLRSGVYKNILTRSDLKAYLWAKVSVTFLVSFFTVFIPLFINQILCLITFPQVGYDNRFALPSYDIGIQNYDSQAIMDVLRLGHPLLYNMVFMVLISLMASLFSIFAFAAFLTFNYNQFSIFTGVFLFITILNLAISLLGSNRLSYTSLLTPATKGSLIDLCLWITGLLVVSSGLVLFKARRIELGIHR